jgi:hypothetical protein
LFYELARQLDKDAYVLLPNNQKSYRIPDTDVDKINVVAAIAVNNTDKIEISKEFSKTGSVDEYGKFIENMGAGYLNGQYVSYDKDACVSLCNKYYGSNDAYKTPPTWIKLTAYEAMAVPGSLYALFYKKDWMEGTELSKWDVVFNAITLLPYGVYAKQGISRIFRNNKWWKYGDKIDDVASNTGNIANKVSQGANDVVFGSAKEFVRTKYGQNTLNNLTAKFGVSNDGAAAVILQKWGDDGLAILNKSTVFTLDDAANELLKNKTAYRHISSNVSYLEQLKSSGKVPKNSNNTYFSLDKFDDPVVAIDKMQLNADATDAVWRLEFDATQLVGKAYFPKAKWNNAEYVEVLTRSYPDFGKGGASQFITQSEITLKRMKNLKTGQIINF